MAEFGRQADLARRLDITKAAVSKAMKRHKIQKAADGFYDLDYLEFLFKQKQDETKTAAQRARIKRPPVIKDPATIRLMVSGLHGVFNEAIKQCVFSGFESADEGDDDLTPEAAFDVAIGFWCSFRDAFNAKFPPGLGDHELQYPALACDYLLRDEPMDDLISRLFVEYSTSTKAPPFIGVDMAGAGE